ncbi:hypothetical protein KFL_002300040 [Klebsormidium nitens]|uniref:Uncharacterized protein n=1 Tax=Klebsormidium nitens TaxID=105231 RepID=A0A1Y1I5U9_KLENI|nr:hypothetical protein KFL_002300040 [Klebsormidium nitens]|eukprot:GAQ85332.1 hypothetical protein KFL_002300040 [Klebsormidium nitens]
MEGSEGDRQRHLEAASKELAAWLDAIPLSGIADLKKRLDEVDKDCKEGLPANLAAAMESGEAREEVEAALGVNRLNVLGRPQFASAGRGRLVGQKADQRQLAAIRARGTFENGDDSDKNTKPDVWRVSRLLQTGSEVRTRWYYTLLVAVLDQIWVQPRRRIADRHGISLAAGLRNTWAGLRGIANGLVGLKIEIFDSAAAVQDIRIDRKTFCVEEGGPSLHPRLFDDESRAFLAKEWSRIASARASAWAIREESRFVEEAIDRVRSKYSQEGTSEADIAAEVRALSRAEEARRLAAAVTDDQVIEEHSPGLGPILARHVEAAWALSAQIHDLQNEQEQVRARHLDKLQTKHPVLVNIEHWKEAQLQGAQKKWRKELQWRPLEEAEQTVGATGEAEARLAAADVTWHQQKLRALKADARASRKYRAPRHRATAFVRIWNPQNFWVDLHRNGTAQSMSWRAHERPRHPGTGTDLEAQNGHPGRYVNYSMRKYDVLATATGAPLWRFQLMGHRALHNFKNGVYLFGSILWKGPLGLRSFISLRPFQLYEWDVRSDNGTVYQRSTGARSTFISRLCTLWSHVFASRERFESEPSRGLIGKSLARPFNLVWNYLAKGALGTALLCAFIPVATLLTVAGSAAVVVTAPVWAPGLALGQYFWDFLLWDGMTGELLPVPKAVLWNIALNGVVNVAASLVGTVLHPGDGVGMYLGGALGLAVVAAWDWLMFWGLLRWHARIPASDTFLCRRIGGADIEGIEKYFVQVAPAAVLLALRLNLQKLLLEAHLASLTWDANAPVREATKLKVFLETLGISASLPNGFGPERNASKLSGIFQRAQQLQDDIRREIDVRFRALGADSGSHYGMSSMVRLSRGDLERTLPVAEDIVRRFILEQLLPVKSRTGSGNNDVAAAFWRDRGHIENDWRGLTRQLLAGAVSDGVLTPLEDDARGITLQVEHVTPKEYVRMLVNDSVHDDLEVAHVVEPPSKTAGAAALRWRDAYSGRGLTCGLRPGAFTEGSVQVWPVDEMDRLLDDLAGFTPAGCILSL